MFPFDYWTGRHQVNVKATYYAENFLKSQHEFRFGVQWSRGYADSLTAAGANGFYTYNYYGDYYGYQYRAYQMPFHYGGISKELGFFVDDTVTVNDRLTLNLGLRYDHNNGEIPSYPIMAVGTPSVSEAGNWIETGAQSEGVPYMTWDTVSPVSGSSCKRRKAENPSCRARSASTTTTTSLETGTGHTRPQRIKKTGLRLLGLTEHGGFRSFSNNVREIKTGPT